MRSEAGPKRSERVAGRRGAGPSFHVCFVTFVMTGAFQSGPTGLKSFARTESVPANQFVPNLSHPWRLWHEYQR